MRTWSTGIYTSKYYVSVNISPCFPFTAKAKRSKGRSGLIGWPFPATLQGRTNLINVGVYEQKWRQVYLPESTGMYEKSGSPRGRQTIIDCGQRKEELKKTYCQSDQKYPRQAAACGCHQGHVWLWFLRQGIHQVFHEIPLSTPGAMVISVLIMVKNAWPCFFLCPAKRFVAESSRALVFSRLTPAWTLDSYFSQCIS